MSLRGNNPHFSHATVFHELNPGHHLQGFMTARYHTHRRLFQTPFWSEGQWLYWEMFLSVFLGAATTGVRRSDVAAFYGERFADAGYALRATLPAGDYTLAVFALSTTFGDFLPARTRSISIR